MPDTEKIYLPQTIADLALPIPGEQTSAAGATTVPVPVGSSTGSAQLTPNEIIPRTFPETVIAVDVIGVSLDTQTQRILGAYTLGELGAIAIGKYEYGVSGDVRITPDGITARNINGEQTFALDGKTGDATFRGTISAGTVIAGATNVGDAHMVMDGVNKRFVVNDGVNDIILIGYQLGGF